MQFHALLSIIIYTLINCLWRIIIIISITYYLPTDIYLAFL